jgi:hypothetical protein
MRKRDSSAARRSRAQGQAVPRPKPASASPPVRNAVPAPRQEALPERRPALPEDQSGRPQVPAQAASRGNNADDLVELSFTDGDGRKKTWSFKGVDRASKALCRPILSCGLVVASIVVPIACVLAHTSMRDKVLCGLGSVVVSGGVWLGSQVKRWLKDRWRKHHDKAPTDDAGTS